MRMHPNCWATLFVKFHQSSASSDIISLASSPELSISGIPAEAPSLVSFKRELSCLSYKLSGPAMQVHYHGYAVVDFVRSDTHSEGNLVEG